MSDSSASERSNPAREAPLAAPPCLTRAFGVKLDLGFDAYGLAPGGEAGPGPATRVALGEPHPVEAWRDGRAEPLFGRSLDDGRTIFGLHQHPRLGYRLFAEGEGTYEIASSLDEVVCAPLPELEAWQWQRFLTAQVLPLVAVLRGREVLHASAVALGERVIALVGGSGAGKTSLALQLVARGATLFADDVLALELRGGVVLAHPGAGVANLSPEERGRLNGVIDDSQIAGRDEQGMRAVVEREARTLPLDAVYFIERPDGGDSVVFERLDSSDRVLGATFNLSILDPARLQRHLEVCAEIARRCGLFRVGVPGSASASDVAAAIAAHAEASS
jgi:hypothetical protein